jgi:AraC-like DNA-binding protein
MSVQQIAGILNVGHEFGRFFGVHEAPSLLLASKSRPQLGITRITVTSAFSEPAGPIHRERGFTIPVYLREPSCENWGTWVDGKFLPIDHWAEGGIGIYDMESNPRAWRTTAYDCLHFNLPRRTLDGFTADSESRRVDTLSCPQGTRDDVLLGLARFILPWLGDQAQMCDLTFDYFVLMFCSHIVATYGKFRVPARRVGGLAPWQRRRVLEIVDAGFDQPLRLSTFAEACGLSLSYFNRAFKQSFGVPAHRYVTQRRVDLAKSLMMNSAISLAEIALRSGFCDQPAFSRTFAAVVGKSPKRWLSEYKSGHASSDG